jgi:CO/xanthine dehydrogenase FAD-binding subunit
MDLNTVTDVIRPRRRESLPQWQDGDAWLAGGTWLFSEPQPQLSRLIDLATLDWPALDIDADGMRIAATCTIAKLESASLPVEWIAAPLIGQCCRAFVASFKIWNSATVGGNICLSLPAGPMISLASALDGVATIWARDGSERRIPVIDFVVDSRTNVLTRGEILRRIDLPASALARRAVFRQISLTPLGRSAALLIGTLSPRDGDFALTVTAATSRPMRLSFPRLPDAPTLRERLACDIPDKLYVADPHGTPAWRRRVTAVLAEDIRQELAGVLVGDLAGETAP